MRSVHSSQNTLALYDRADGKREVPFVPSKLPLAPISTVILHQNTLQESQNLKDVRD